jgi:hypothetical protein
VLRTRSEHTFRLHGSTGDAQVLREHRWYSPSDASRKRGELKALLMCLAEEASTRVKYQVTKGI